MLEMIKKHENLVYHFAHKYYSNFMEFEDIVSVGRIGLIKAIKDFDESRNIKFSTLASVYIRNEILMELRKFNRYHTKNKKEILSLNNVHYLENQDSFEYINLIEDDFDIQKSLEIKFDTELIMSKLKFLKFVEREIIKMIYFENMKHTEIGKVLGYPRVQVSKYHARALKKLRRMLEVKSCHSKLQ